MKIIIGLLLLSFSASSQNRTNVWELSYPLIPGGSNCEIQYQNGVADTNSVSRVMDFFVTDASICDTAGTLLFYTNGLTIGNRVYDTLLNAINFNPGWATEFDEPDGMSSCQGVLIIPSPGNSKQYYIFHESGESFIAYNIYQVQPLHLSYSVVDMNLDNGLGGIIDTLKNQYAITDTLFWGGLTAVKHANGRDWWIIVHRFYNDKYYKLLLTPEGLLGPYEQTIGSNLEYDVANQATFSPDGSKYCISTHRGLFNLLDFNRCTGEFSNAVAVYSPDSFIYGSSFSPNSRFIYVSSLYNLYQYDTWDNNMVANVQYIAGWDSFVDPIYHIPVLFFMHQMGPDNRIYMGTFNSSLYLNVINSPDSFGLSCDFQPHSFILPDEEYNSNVPSFPNYDLGVLEGSSCDTLNEPTGNSIINGLVTKISPNPADDWLNIVYHFQEDVMFEMYDTYGKQVMTATLFKYFRNRLINVSDLPAGVYLTVVTQMGTKIWSDKVVIGH